MAGEATLRYEIDERARILSMDLVSGGAADRILDVILGLITARPELCGWDWIVECEPLPDDAGTQHLAQLSEAWGPPPKVEAVTVFVTQDRLLHLWARVMDFQFVRRKHLVERDIEAARRLIERRRALRPLR
ncbi:hypothetical protein GCM10017620_08350 [Brevundimonas intermedia]|uniref:STAS/SEC14 domain-containing protein n=1 Tax=Brevundimonas intermedia TaxID=74315 RepID=A0ABQ5T6U1_9CAUL|nr:hypothetical protein [Brevundimonas intermedia]GLK47862.1 hypothetical protein GCM10017620_08350 [Brevundimonas intermedia]